MNLKFHYCPSGPLHEAILEGSHDGYVRSFTVAHIVETNEGWVVRFMFGWRKHDFPARSYLHARKIVTAKVMETVFNHLGSVINDDIEKGIER